MQIILYPAIVQGDAAAESIVKGIHALEEAQVDVIIAGRGGGSIEDLWAFNEERVAQAIFDCSIPVISAVGHETDTTIADYVADLRAPTPSAAAELAVCDISLVFRQLEGIKAALNRQMSGRIKLARANYKALGARLKVNSPAGRIRERRLYAIHLEDRINAAMKDKIVGSRHRLAIYIEKMKGNSPLDRLNQGYSYVSDSEGKTVTDIGKVNVGDRLMVYVKNGRMETEVTGICPESSFMKDFAARAKEDE